MSKEDLENLGTDEEEFNALLCKAATLSRQLDQCIERITEIAASKIGFTKVMTEER